MTILLNILIYSVAGAYLFYSYIVCMLILTLYLITFYTAIYITKDKNKH